MGLHTVNRVLVVDDEEAIIAEYVRAFVGRIYSGCNTSVLAELRAGLFDDAEPEDETIAFSVETCAQGEAAVTAVNDAQLSGEPFNVVFIDLDMPPGIDGATAARRIREADADIHIVIVTGSGVAEPEKLCSDISPPDRVFFFRKPFHAVECRQLAVALCGKWRADLALRAANEQLEDRIWKRTKQLHRLAFFDQATNLPNRNKLLGDLNTAVASSEAGELSVGLILLDIERFGFINETLGYETGTQLLVAVSERLSAVLREDDIAGRFGSDEFACVVHGFESRDDLQRIVSRVRSVFAESFELADRDMYVKCAVGVASYPDHATGAEQLFSCAEAALNRSKRHVIRDAVFYEAEMGEQAQHRLGLEHELRAALTDEQIRPYFQPQVSLVSGKVVAAEALARWRKPCGELVSPAAFIPLIDELGLSDELFACMLRQVARQIDAWSAQHTVPPISINMSAIQLRNRNFVSSLAQTLDEYGLGPATISLELTESALLDDVGQAKAILTELRRFGVDVHIDDFGTGYSSLSYLAELPLQALKIDRYFIARMSEDPTQQRLVSSIIALGHSLALSIVAEGIENAEQIEMLRDCGCDVVQGYLIGVPMPAEEFAVSVFGQDAAVRSAR